MPEDNVSNPESNVESIGGAQIRCRFCGQLNQTRPEANGSAKCGRCRLPLSDVAHKKFAELSKHEYIHPADSRALSALRAIPGIDTAVKKLLSVTGESAIRVIFMASAVRVTPQQCPDLYAKLQVACTTLGVDMPDLYVQQSPVVNAFTGGVERPTIVLYSGLLERLTDEETLAVIAHARDFQKNYDEKALDRFWADIITSGLTHPFPVWRVSEILKWTESGDYGRLINGEAASAAA